MASVGNLNTKTVYSNQWTLLLFFVCFFQPLMLWDRVPFNFFFDAIQLLMWSILVLTQLLRIKKWHMYLYVWTVFCLIQIGVIISNSTVVGSEPLTAVETVLSYLLLVHFLDVFFSRAQKKEMLFFWGYLFGMVILELISIPLYEVGLISIYWLGIKTRATETLIALLLITLILKDKLKKSWYYSAIIMCIMVAVILRISTALLGIVMIAGFWWLLKRKQLKWLLKLLQPSTIITVTLLLTIGILFFNFQTHFASLFQTVFSKDITFSGRTWTWEDAIPKLQNYDDVHKLYGFGFYNVRIWCDWKWIKYSSEAHNQLLQMLHDTGIVGTILLYIFWYFEMRGLNRCKNIDLRNIIASVCLVYFIMSITEIYCYHSYFYIVFSLAAKSEDIAENLRLYEFKWRFKDDT